MVKPLMEPAINGTLLFILAPRITIFSRNKDTQHFLCFSCFALPFATEKVFFNIIIIKKSYKCYRIFTSEVC